MIELLLVSTAKKGFVPPPVLDSSVYKGFVKSADLITNQALSAAIPFTAGTVNPEDGGWLHYIDGDYEFYIARLPIRYGMSGASITAAGLVAGKLITFGGKTYRVRLMTGMSPNPFPVIANAQSSGEWNKWLYPIFNDVGRPVAPNWSSYSSLDLGLRNAGIANGSISVIAEMSSAAGHTNVYGARGYAFNGSTTESCIARRTYINDAAPSEGNSGFGVNAYGFRPILEYQPPPPVLTDTWAKLANLPVERNRGSAVEINGVIYVYGGFEGSTATGTLYAYTIATDTWKQLASFNARAQHAACVINGKMYIHGGVDASNVFYNTVLEYDPATNTWVNLSFDSASATATVVQRHKIAVDGTGFVVMGGIITASAYNASMQRFDVVTRRWGPTFGSFSSALFGIATNRDKAYTVGGFNGAGTAVINDILLPTGAITVRAPISSTRFQNSSGYMKRGVYTFGGQAGTAADGTVVQRFNTDANTWQNLGAIPFAVNLSMSCVVGNSCYIVGGLNAAGNLAYRYDA